MDYTNIMALLSKYSPEEIAESFSKELNAAVKKQEEEKEINEKARLAAATDLLSALNAFFAVCYPDSNVEIKITAKELLESLDEFIPEMKKLNATLDSISKTLKPSEFAAVPKFTNDPITSFLRFYNL